MAIKIDYSQSSLSSGLDRMGVKLGAQLLMYASSKAEVLRAKMKQNRPWTDRTNMAKNTLNAKVSRPDDNTIRITLAHGVSYGISLELEHNKRYAIVGPTVRQEGPHIVSDLRGLMSKTKL